MKRQVAVIGGDARYLELIRQLQINEEIDVVLIGYDQLETSYTGLKRMDLKDLQTSLLEAVILPVRGIDPDGTAEAVFSEKKIVLEAEWFKSLPENTMVFTGIANEYLSEACDQAGLNLIRLMDRDDVAIFNSIPTAEGTLLMAIENTDYTIHSARVTVAGFGRVGETLARTFQALGAKVTASARKNKDLARIVSQGLDAVPFSHLNEAARTTDILINTVPSKVIDEKVICELPPHALILDLASKPGGTDFEYADRRGIKAILAKSLPGIVAPKTAGKILADVIVQELEEKQKGVKIE